MVHINALYYNLNTECRH